jgi:metallo-beta-lactamase family protein
LRQDSSSALEDRPCAPQQYFGKGKEMKITVRGAGGGEVTGSAYLVQTRDAKVLVDCGLFQGTRKVENYNRMPKKGDFEKLDSVVLTHAHLDHTGRLPLLTRAGYAGPIYATPATIDFADLILNDSAHLQQSDVERENRRRRRTGQPLLDPLYEQRDVERLRPLYKKLAYDKPTPLAPGISVRAVEAGHMLGSVSLELKVEDGGKKKVVIFSGDLGPRGAPLHRDYVPFEKADVVFMESTYGDRDHRSLKETAVETRKVVKQAVNAGAKILVPTFAVGRTQLLLYLLAGAFQRGTLPPFPIYIDSPMAIQATKLYAKHVELFDDEALAMQQSGELREQLDTAKFCPTANDSRALNDVQGPCLIMAGAGMCTGGRILHHFRHNLARPGTTVLFVGYQGHGSLGRMIVDGKPTVTIFGEKIPVRASVHTFGGLSGHAGQTDLLRWLDSFAASGPRVFLTHGEERGRKPLGKLIKDRHQLRVDYPGLNDTIEI